MKKNKILTLVALGTLSVGVVAGGVALTTTDNLAANAGESSACNFVFDGKDKVITEGATTYAQDKTLRVFYKNGTDAADRKSHVDLAKGGEMYLDGTAYSASKGWGSAAHGIEELKIDIQAGTTASYDVYTSFTSIDEFNKVNDQPLTASHVISVTNSANGEINIVKPTYFKIVALEPISIKSVEINCTAVTEEADNNVLNEGTYSASMTVNDNKGNPYTQELTVIKVDKYHSLTFNVYNPNTHAWDYPIKLWLLDSDSSGAVYTLTPTKPVDELHKIKMDYANPNHFDSFAVPELKITVDGFVIYEYYPCATLDVKEFISYSETNPLGNPVELTKNDSIQLKAYAKDENGHDSSEDIVWTLKTNSVVKFQDTIKKVQTGSMFTFDAIKEGDAVLTVKCGEATKTINFKVTVPAGSATFPAELNGKTITFADDTDTFTITFTNVDGACDWESAINGTGSYTAQDLTITADGTAIKLSYYDKSYTTDITIDGDTYTLDGTDAGYVAAGAIGTIA